MEGLLTMLLSERMGVQANSDNAPRNAMVKELRQQILESLKKDNPKPAA